MDLARKVIYFLSIFANDVETENRDVLYLGNYNSRTILAGLLK